MIILSCIFFVFLTVFLFKSFPPLFVTKTVIYFTKPLVSLKNKTYSFVKNFYFVFQDKKDLENQNIVLRQKLIELELRDDFFEILETENKELKEVLSFKKEKSLMLASILLRPSYGIYNSLVVDVGSKHGVKEGMLVTAFGNVLLGHIYEAAPNISRVKLISSPEEEANVFIGNRVSAIAVGLGGENMVVDLPTNIDINIGDSVVSLDTNSLFLGVVEELIQEPTSPFQKIIFRLPVNIQELRHVYIVK